MSYVIKVNGTVFPNALLASYSNVPNRRQDKDSYTDGRGVTHRNILPVKRNTVKLKTIDGLTQGQKQIVQSFFPNRDYVNLAYWNDEDNSYKSGVFYVPDIEYSISHIDKKGNFIYDAIEIEFIDYGA